MDIENKRARPMTWPPVLRAGFRPFFLGGALWALLVVALWVCTLNGAITLPTELPPLAWHRHEMLFGFLSGVISGFLLTAIPNWTGRLPIHGARLGALAGLWLAARIAVLFSSWVGTPLAVTLDVGFLLTLCFVAAREVIKAKNRNLPIVMAIGLFAFADAVDHAEAAGWNVPAGLGWRFGFGIVLLLIGLVGGRIIPSFTRNWLVKRSLTDRLPVQPDRIDGAVLAITGVSLFAWAAVPGAAVSAVALILAGLAQIIRLARWSGHKTIREPLLLILHVAYAWLPIGLVLLGLSHFMSRIPASTALHALSAGAMASMSLAVMTRATLGHTGRDLRADGWTKALYLCVTCGAIVRVAASALPFDYRRSIEIAGTLWGGAFLLFVVAYGPKLVGPRPDGGP